MLALIVIGGFIALMLLGVPVTIAVGAATIAGLFAAGFSGSLYIVPMQVTSGVESHLLLAIPFFVMAGNLMNAGGMTDRIFNFASALVGHFRGGLAQVNVLASMIFAGISGAAVADAAGLGKIEIKAMKDHGYTPEYAGAVTVASSMIGPLIPPSIGLLIYSFLSGESVGRLFLAGVVPGLLVGVALMIFNFFWASRINAPREPRASLRQIARTGVDGIAALIAPGFIVGAILFGFVTATEAGILACAYALVLGLAHRELTIKRLWAALVDTMEITAVIMMIIGFSTLMAWLFTVDQLPQEFATFATGLTDNPTLFLLIVAAFLLVVGAFIEGVPAMLILVPIFLPVVDALGIDRIHFGLVFHLALLIGIATPPMGIGLFIVAEVGKIPFEKLSVAVLPLLVPIILVLLLITLVPETVLFLPDLIMGPQ
jgi:tripartite ATP-independent transporter DctM subunit